MQKFVCLVAVVVLCLWNTVESVKYPDGLPKCKFEDHRCITNAINSVIVSSSNGHRGLHLIPIDPLKVKTMVLAQNPNSPVSIQLKFVDAALHGFKNTRIDRVTGFQKDPKTATFEVHAKIPVLKLLGNYEIKGNVLILPIVGHGKSNMTLLDVDARFKFVGGSEKKNGEEYLKISKFKLDFDISRLIVHFENLFNGDKALGDNMNLFINENWKEVFDEIHQSITDAISEVLVIAIQTPFSAIPYKDMFLA